MTLRAPFLTAVVLGSGTLLAQEDEFGQAARLLFADADRAQAQAVEVTGPDLDRTRGQIVFQAKDGRYEKGAHFGKWFWPGFTGERGGSYQVKVTYASSSPKQGFQFFVGPQKARGYLGPTAGMQQERTARLDRIVIPDRGTYPVGMLSGDDSNHPGFQLRQVLLEPAPEGEAPAQGIDGSATLEAGCATTFSRLLRYDSSDGKNSLTCWTEAKDWAEWIVSLHQGGKFRVELTYACSGANRGSQVALWIDDRTFPFTVEDTGGFQKWKPQVLGEVELPAGRHRVVIQPLTKAAEEILEVQKVTLLPVAPAP